MNTARARLIPFIKSRAPRAQLNAHYKRDAKRARTSGQVRPNKNEHSARGGPSITAFEIVMLDDAH